MKKIRMYICNSREAIPHCMMQCPGGKPHAADGCTKSEYCAIISKDCKCVPATQKQIKEALSEQTDN